MSEKTFFIHSKKFEIEKTSYFDDAPISSVEPIEQGGENIENVSGLDRLVEAPLLDACKIFNSKGIKTIFSSANKKDVMGCAHIAIDFDSLSARNKELAVKTGEIGKAHGSIEKQAVYIKIPILADTTVGEIKRKAIKIAQSFDQQ